MKPRFSIMPIVIFALLTGCSSSQSPGAVERVPVANDASGQTAQVTIAVTVPSASKMSSVQRDYVSPATESISVSIVLKNGTEGPFVGNCPNGFCEQTVQAPVGTDLFRVSLYDTKNAGGHMLSSGSRVVAIAAGTNNDVAITFNPVVTSALAKPAPNFSAGEAAADDFSVQARDPSAADIVAPGNYEDGGGDPASVAVSLDGAPGHYKLTGTTSFASPAPADASPAVKLAYDGAIPNFDYPSLNFTIGQTLISSQAVTVSPTSVASPTVLADSTYAIGSAARGGDGNVYFTAFGTHGSEIGKFDVSSRAITTFPLLAGTKPRDIVAGADGDLYFFEPGTTTFGQLTPPGTLRQFPVSFNAFDLVRGVDGNVWFLEDTNAIGKITTGGVVTTVASLAKTSYVDAYLSPGPGSKMWYLATQSGPNQLDSINPDGSGFASVDVNVHDQGEGRTGLYYAPDGYFYSISRFTIGKTSSGGFGIEAFTSAGLKPSRSCSAEVTDYTASYTGRLSDGTTVFTFQDGSSPSPSIYSAIRADGTCVSASEPRTDQLLTTGIIVAGSSAGHAFDIIGNSIYEFVY